MTNASQDRQRPFTGSTRRLLLALDPIFEAGRQGERAQAWDVEDELTAVAVLGDVTIDLSHVKSAPDELTINAYAVWRDVDVIVAAGTRVELSGGVFRGDLVNETPDVPRDQCHRVVRINGHTVLGDVTVRTVPASS